MATRLSTLHGLDRVLTSVGQPPPPFTFHSIGSMSLAQIHSVLVSAPFSDAQLLLHGGNVQCHGEATLAVADGGCR